MIESLRRAWFSLEDRVFDLRHRIDTRCITSDLAAPAGAENSLHATCYQPVWTRNLRVLLREASRHGKQHYFVDIGAGKGKACIYAAQYFDNVIGVEYAPALLKSAEINCQRVGQKNIDLVLTDASQFDLPEKSSLVFMFNPFDDVLLTQFISRNLERMRINGSFIAYANDIQRNTLIELGFECIFREENRSISLWRVQSILKTNFS